MTPKERFIAQAALRVGRSARLEQLYSSMSAATAIDHDELKPIVQQLVTAGYLKVCTTPEKSESWYEKGDMWRG